MAVSHIKSDTIADFTGTFTGFNSQGSTTTIAATDVVRPSDWNSAHNQFYTLTGNTTGNSTASGTNVLFAGSGGISVGGSTGTIVISGPTPFTGSWWQPEVYGNTLTTTFANNTVYFRPFEVDEYYNVNNLVLQMSGSSTRTTASFSGSLHTSAAGVDAASSGTGQYGLKGTVLLFSRFNTNETHADFTKIQTFDSHTYSIGAGYSASASWHMSSSSASVSITTSGAVSWIKNIDTAGGITTTSSGTSNSTSFSSTSTNAQTISSSFILSFPYAHLSGFRPIFAPMADTALSPGQYWLGLQQSTSTARTNMTLESVAQLVSAHMMVYTVTTNNYMEVGNSVAITSSNWRLGFGSHSNTSGTTTTMALSAISSMGSNASIWFALNGNTV